MEKIDFRDSDGMKDFDDNNTERYKGREKYKDMIVIISDIYKWGQHVFNFKPNFANCNILDGKCLFHDEGYDVKPRAGCIIVHIAEKESRSKAKWREVGEVRVWLFGKDKVRTLNGIFEDYPEIEESLNKTDFLVTTSDEEFQKIELRPTFKDSRLTADMVDKQSYKEAMEKLTFFAKPCDVKRQKEILGFDSGDDRDDGEFISEVKNGKRVSHEKLDSGKKAVEDRMGEIDMEEKKETKKDNNVADILSDLGGDDKGDEVNEGRGVPFDLEDKDED